MSNNNSNTVQAFWVMLGSFSAFLVSILSAAILSRYLDKTEYGTYRQILFVYTTLLFVFTAGLPRVFQYYLPRYSIEKGRDIVFKVTKMLFFLGILFSLFLFLLSDSIALILNNEELSSGLKYFSLIPMLLLPTMGIEGVFSSYRKTKYIAKYNIITRTLQLIGIITPVIFFDGTYISAIIGWSIASVITLNIAWYYKKIPFKEVVKYEKSHLTYKEIFSYSIPLVVASIAGIAIKSADQFYISRYFGPETFAEFANGFMELPFVAMITGATSTVVMPLFSKMFFDKEDVNNLVKMWSRALIKSAILIYPLVVFFIAFARDIMEILYTSKYSSSGIYFQISLFLNFFNIVIFAPLFFSMGKTRLYAKVHIILAIIVWILDFLLIKIFMNPVAIAISSTSIHIIKTIWFLYLASSLLKISFFNFFPLKSLSKLALHSGIIALGIVFLNKYIYFSDILLIKVLVSAILYAVLILISAPLFNINYWENLTPIITIFKKNLISGYKI